MRRTRVWLDSGSLAVLDPQAYAAAKAQLTKVEAAGFPPQATLRVLISEWRLTKLETTATQQGCRAVDPGVCKGLETAAAQAEANVTTAAAKAADEDENSYGLPVARARRDLAQAEVALQAAVAAATRKGCRAFDVAACEGAGATQALDARMRVAEVKALNPDASGSGHGRVMPGSTSDDWVLEYRAVLDADRLAADRATMQFTQCVAFASEEVCPDPGATMARTDAKVEERVAELLTAESARRERTSRATVKGLKAARQALTNARSEVEVVAAAARGCADPLGTPDPQSSAEGQPQSDTPAQPPLSQTPAEPPSQTPAEPPSQTPTQPPAVATGVSRSACFTPDDQGHIYITFHTDAVSGTPASITMTSNVAPDTRTAQGNVGADGNVEFTLNISEDGEQLQVAELVVGGVPYTHDFGTYAPPPLGPC